MTTIQTFSGLQFELRRAGKDDAALLREFWRHVSSANLRARYIGIDDPRDAAGSALHEDDGPTAMFLAFGADPAVICVGLLVEHADGERARVMVFTREGITAHGVSWAVLELLLSEARNAGVQTVTSVFNVKDARAIRLERGMGFVERPYPGHADYRLLEWNLSQSSASVQPVIRESIPG